MNYETIKAAQLTLSRHEVAMFLDALDMANDAGETLAGPLARKLRAVHQERAVYGPTFLTVSDRELAALRHACEVALEVLADQEGEESIAFNEQMKKLNTELATVLP